MTKSDRLVEIFQAYDYSQTAMRRPQNVADVEVNQRFVGKKNRTKTTARQVGERFVDLVCDFSVSFLGQSNT